LDDAGFENVLEYEGGLKDWKTAGFMTDGADTARAA
jgi:rhodanese-related sulfurtransferase